MTWSTSLKSPFINKMSLLQYINIEKVFKLIVLKGDTLSLEDEQIPAVVELGEVLLLRKV